MPKWKNALQSSEEVYRIKRDAVLREATRTFGRRGFHDTSLDHIAEALEVSKGTLYNYFHDKQEILFECHKMALDLGDYAFSFAEANGKTGLERLRFFIRCYLCWLYDTFDGGGVVSDVTALRQSDRQSVIARRDAVEKRLIGYFEQGVSDGSLRQTDAPLGVYTIMGAINSVQSWYDPKGRLEIASIASRMADQLLHGVDRPAPSAQQEAPIPSLNEVGRPLLLAGGLRAQPAPRAAAGKSRAIASKTKGVRKSREGA